MASETSLLRDALIAECQRLETFAQTNSATHFSAASLLRRAHVALGAFAVIVGAVGSSGAIKVVADALEKVPKELLLAATVAPGLAGILGGILAFWNISAAHV